MRFLRIQRPIWLPDAIGVWTNATGGETLAKIWAAVSSAVVGREVGVGDGVVVGDSVYNDVYDVISNAGGSRERESQMDLTNRLVHQHFEGLRSHGLITGPGANLIDLGCGPGQNAVRFAELGYRVTGVDISRTAIDMANHRASQENLNIDFRIDNVLALDSFSDSSFDVATDIGCWHMLVREEHRHSYLKSVRRVLCSGGVFFIFNRVSSKDTIIADEGAHVMRHITLVQNRWIGNDGTQIKVRNTAFRNASMRQYCQELEATGFDVVRLERVNEKGAPAFGMLLARVP